jgi:iron complex transport system permease protein
MNMPLCRTRAWALLIILTVVLLISMVISAGIGSAHLSPSDVLQAVWDRLRGISDHGMMQVIVWDVRLPRIALALLVGGSLAVAGVVMQSLFHNPMADPYIVGVSSGAGFGAVLAVILGLQNAFLGMNARALTAFVGGVIAIFAVYLLSRRRGRVPVTALLLTGIAVGSLLQAITAFLIMQRSNGVFREVMLWLMGSLANRDWSAVAALAPYAILGVAVAGIWARDLNVLALGDDTAHHLGINLERARFVLLVIASLLAAAAVAVCGIIAFVGLIVPHLMRLLVGPNHRVLLPASVLGGGLLLLWSDVLARTLLPGGEVPISIVTSVVGAPFFLYLLHQRIHRA